MAVIVWHDRRPVLNELIKTAKANPSAVNIAALKAEIDESMSDNSYVGKKGDMVFAKNNQGRSFSVMDQADMAIVLFRAGYLFNKPEWVKLGIQVIETTCVLYDDGGLRLKGNNDTAWFCGQTSRTQKDKGGTLNKHLFAASAFLDIVAAIEDLGDNNRSLIDKYRNFAIQGLMKMFKGDDLPKMDDFFIRDGKNPYLKAWIYYGASNVNSNKVYYLRNKPKNGSYHILCMNLIHNIATGVQSHIGWNNFKSDAKGTLSKLYTIYDNKVKDGGLSKNSKSAHGGQFGKIYHIDKPLNADAIEWYKQF